MGMRVAELTLTESNVTENTLLGATGAWALQIRG